MRKIRSRQELEEDGYYVSGVRIIYAKSGNCYAPRHDEILYSITESKFAFVSQKGHLVATIEEKDVEMLIFDKDYSPLVIHYAH